MKITAITAQQKDKNRANIMVDGAYRFSLDVFQVGELVIRVGKDYTEEELMALETESLFGKVYARTLQYCLMRLHSAKEIRDYLARKTRDAKGRDGEIRKGISGEIAERVFERLDQKGYIDDERFARHWLESRNLTKGASRRKLIMELRSKGIEQAILDKLIAESSRTEEDELRKVILRKGARYADEQKLVYYLLRQGFNYDDIKQQLTNLEAP